ncbi:MAG: hypothetical protein KDI80_09780 [Xanthomonadales bacterium]|nr:hypothetical protein [Xanthomonadales bacterium]
MNEIVDQNRRAKQVAIAGMLGVSLVTGIVVTAMAPDPAVVGVPMWVQFVANLALLLLGFRWLQIDSAELDIRRPLWLNIGIILLAAVFVPYYFYKTRPAGARVVPILSFFGLVIACAMASAIGTFLMAAVQPGSAPPSTF